MWPVFVKKYVHLHPLLHRQKCLVVDPRGDHVLAGQGWMMVGLLQKLLAGQGGHWVRETSPVLSEYVPRGQAMTVPKPQKKPAGQGKHLPPSGEGTVPKTHARQIVAPPQATAWMGHFRQALIPAAFE